MLFIGSVRERLAVIGLSEDEYVIQLEHWSKESIAGGTIYDAMLASCAIKAEAGTIYTWNLRHFRQLGPEIGRRLKTPAADR